MITISPNNRKRKLIENSRQIGSEKYVHYVYLGEFCALMTCRVDKWQVFYDMKFTNIILRHMCPVRTALTLTEKVPGAIQAIELCTYKLLKLQVLVCDFLILSTS